MDVVPVNPLPLQGVLLDVTRICRERGGELAVIVAVVGGATAVTGLAVSTMPGDYKLLAQLLALALAASFHAWGNGAVAHLSVATLSAKECSLGSAAQAIGPNAVSLVVAHATVSAATVVGCLFVIPGVVMHLMFWLTVSVVVVETSGPFQAMRRSARLTDGDRGRLFLLALVQVAVWVLLWGVVLVLVPPVIAALVPPVAAVASAVTVSLIQSAQALVGWLLGAVAFHRLREAAGELRPEYTGVFE